MNRTVVISQRVALPISCLGFSHHKWRDLQSPNPFSQAQLVANLSISSCSRQEFLVREATQQPSSPAPALSAKELLAFQRLLRPRDHHHNEEEEGKGKVFPLVESIVFNSLPTEDSGLLHLEVTSSTVRLEFRDGFCKGYRSLAATAFLTLEERKKRAVPPHLIPIKLENLSSCGGGATVLLDRSLVSEALVHQLQSLSSPLSLPLLSLPPSGPDDSLKND